MYIFHHNSHRDNHLDNPRHNLRVNLPVNLHQDQVDLVLNPVVNLHDNPFPDPLVNQHDNPPVNHPVSQVHNQQCNHHDNLHLNHHVNPHVNLPHNQHDRYMPTIPSLQLFCFSCMCSWWMDGYSHPDLLFFVTLHYFIRWIIFQLIIFVHL